MQPYHRAYVNKRGLTQWASMEVVGISTQQPTVHVANFTNKLVLKISLHLCFGIQENKDIRQLSAM